MDLQGMRDLAAFLKGEMAPALGVTEPGAIALASAKAYEAIGGDIEKITVSTDEGVFKNGFSCAIPGTDDMGNELAAILGAIAGDPSLGLKVLSTISKEDIEKAKKMREEGVAEVNVKRGVTDLVIEAVVKTNCGVGKAVIRDKHDNIVLVESNGKAVYQAEQKDDSHEHSRSLNIKELTLKDIVDFVENVPYEDIEFVMEAVKINKELAQEGLNGPGMGIGKALRELVEENVLDDNIIVCSQMLTAYAIDARMGGVPKPAMSICGSGDHGLISTLPLIAIAEKKKIDEEKLARAIALSYLVTAYIKAFAGRLSAFCGCAVAAGTGVSSGATYLFGGNIEQIGYAIKNMACNITGIICDGGNFGCSFKAVTAAEAAILSALFAIKNVRIPDDSGIVGNSAEETMQNIGKIACPGMLKTNDVIIDIMVSRRRDKANTKKKS
ncbi:serine dehydratase-like, subunit alpha [Thermacetogenium phaeum DSM 12270]|uniref:UPF0597 protein Tph_c24600 n=1 Tax=Thermacetogenium phaeum (strain ATCC BAA-254 / DSM 26808 / PB) TaxID=1089553 RepID=K4LKM2_THEPS|nr:L-serine ammonia-lyase, iron-sulfur-dependent, subunit alpha [Thermacetogenium phaeum]AFV12637.1 serine dehydratase-like, subunit alpha [Thermacetogenium phaeum DSM 12270]